jgi:hypothetical protein
VRCVIPFVFFRRQWVPGRRYRVIFCRHRIPFSLIYCAQIRCVRAVDSQEGLIAARADQRTGRQVSEPSVLKEVLRKFKKLGADQGAGLIDTNWGICYIPAHACGWSDLALQHPAYEEVPN